MDPIELGIKFVRSNESASTPVNSTSDIAQTGDINVMLVLGIVLLTVAISCVVLFVFKKSKQLDFVSHALGNNLVFSNLSLATKLISIVIGAFSILCIVLGCFTISAHAVDNNSLLVPDKSEITATVSEDGSFTLDSCLLTNENICKYSMASSVVTSLVDGLDDTEITVEGFEGVIFEGNPSEAGTIYNPSGLIKIEPETKTELRFDISFDDSVDIENLIDKKVFTIELIPEEYYYINLDSNNYGTLTSDFTDAQVGTSVTLTTTPNQESVFLGWRTTPSDLQINPVTGVDNKYTFTMPETNTNIYAEFVLLWTPMQAKTGDGIKIDFYPAFNSASEVSGYQFFVKNEEDYIEISSADITMKKIYDALQPQDGEKTTTLYYRKIDIDAPVLKCYTVKNISWKSVFVPTQTPGESAKEYTKEFKKNYTDMGIYTAELGIVNEDGKIYNPFGNNWDINVDSSKIMPTINGVDYDFNNGAGGFYGSYGTRNGGLLSSNSHHVWGACEGNTNNVSCEFICQFDEWANNTGFTWDYGMVLARLFD